MDINVTTQSKKSSWRFWCFFLLVVFCEFFLFKQYVFNEVIDFYPRSFDQANYLMTFYLTHENIKKYGLIDALYRMQPLASSTLFSFQAAFFFLILGASRWSALLINFIYFIALQVCSLLVFRSITKNTYLIFCFLGILLAINTPFFTVGGSLFDIRIDFMAFCLYGIFVALTVKSEFFLNRKWTFITALLASFLILMRTIVAAYMVGIMACLFFYLAFCLLRANAKSNIRLESSARLKNVVIFCLILGLITLPCIWFNREILYNYYMVGHVLNGEKYIRAEEVGITDRLSALQFYPRNLLSMHFGRLATAASLFLVLFYYFLSRVSFNIKVTSSKISKNSVKLGFIFLLLAIFIPMLILTLDMSKSVIVASIMVMPAIWLVIWYCLMVDANIKLAPAYKKIVKYSACLILLMGMTHQFFSLRSHLSQRQLHDYPIITQMYLDIGDYAAAKQWPLTLLAYDQIRDYLSYSSMITLYYEKKGKFLYMGVEKLGGAIFSITEQEALASLKRANFFILNINEYDNHSPYPFDQSMQQLKPLLKKYADTHFKKLADYHLKGMTYRVYVTTQ